MLKVQKSLHFIHVKPSLFVSCFFFFSLYVFFSHLKKGLRKNDAQFARNFLLAMKFSLRAYCTHFVVIIIVAVEITLPWTKRAWGTIVEQENVFFYIPSTGCFTQILLLFRCFFFALHFVVAQFHQICYYLRTRILHNSLWFLFRVCLFTNRKPLCVSF